MSESKPMVLFVCVHNAGKSQMAAALMRAKAGDLIHVISGGTHPGTAINANAQKVVEELGASMQGEHPKAITQEMFMQADRIIILGNEAKLAPRDGMRGVIETWLTPEPETALGDKLAQTRLVRDDIARRVKDLFIELTNQ